MRPISSWSEVSCRRSSGYLRKPSTTRRFEDESIRVSSVRLNDLKQLLTLLDTIVVCVKDLDVNAKAVGSLLRGCSLLHLKVVVVRCE